MKITAQELAKFLNARLEGDRGAMISGISSPEDAGSEDLIYVEAAKHAGRAQASAARCIIVAEGMRLEKKTLLIAAQPKLAFARAAARLVEEPPIASGVHPTAVVDSSAKLSAGVGVGPYAVIEAGARIGAETQIGAFCFIARDAQIGESCRFFPRVSLYPRTRIGNRVRIHSGAVIGSDGFGYVLADGHYEKFPQAGIVQIEDDVEIGSNVTIDRGSLGTTRIGRGAKIDNLVHVGHNVQIGEHTIIAAQTGISGSCKIGDRVVIGGQAGFGEHCEVENGSVIGGQAGVLNGKTVRSSEIVWGTPARPLAKFKKQFAWFERLPELAERLRAIEQRIGK
ncbi:MAG TPA: UDP-3-O-(3-hydroxymyristoyl)glucosamine N-acyltransferase [Verrucomicrobiae bacterium]|nr:UDP-3-O-(3-hydroxymyristoyl)glucosamine N-acyltransferase [Verrucomicrobiae bacterium]